MKTIVLIRHAKSSWDNPADADFDRPLNKRGLHDGAQMAKRLHMRLPAVELFLSSAARRATETAGLFNEAFPSSSIRVESELYLAPADALLDCIASLPDEVHTAAVVAHNPGITDLANLLTEEIQTDNVPTSGVFAVESSVAHWKEFAAAAKHFLFFDYPKAPPAAAH